jgi:hypothetical protein
MLLPVCQCSTHPIHREEQPMMQTPWTNSVRTLDQARDFVLEVRMCGVLHDSKGALPTLWNAVHAPDQ